MNRRIYFHLPTILFLIIILLLNFLVLHKSFNLGLYGDDWLQLYNLWLEFDIRQNLSFFDIRSYLGAYLPQYIFLGIIHSIAGYDPKAYFLASYILKVCAATSLYFFSLQLSKSKLIAIITTIFFIISATGLETTDWVFNMNTFAGLFFFLIASTFFLKIRQIRNIFSWQYIFFTCFLSLSLFIVPVRMHGAVPFLILADLYLTFFIEKKGISRLLIIRLLTAILILFLFVKAGSYGTPEYSRGRMLEGITSAQSLIQEGKLDFLFYFFGAVGNMVIPSSFNIAPIYVFSQTNISSSYTQFAFILLLSIIFFVIELGFAKVIFNYKKTLPTLLIFNSIIFLVGILIVKINPGLSPQTLFSIIIGLHFFTIGILTTISRRNSNTILASSLGLSMLWIITFTLVYWIYSPYLILETTSRYLTFGAIGVSIFLASFIVEGFKNAKSRLHFFIIPLALLLFYSIAHFSAGQLYLNNLERNRNQTLTQNSWDKLLEEVPALDSSAPSIFYMTTDNPQSLFGVFTFGFWPRAGLMYKIEDPQKTPILTDNYPELILYAKDGSPLKKIHGRPDAPVPLDRIFAFDFRNGKLTNQTDKIRKQIKNDLE